MPFSSPCCPSTLDDPPLLLNYNNHQEVHKSHVDNHQQTYDSHQQIHETHYHNNQQFHEHHYHKSIQKEPTGHSNDDWTSEEESCKCGLQERTRMVGGETSMVSFNIETNRQGVILLPGGQVSMDGVCQAG